MDNIRKCIICGDEDSCKYYKWSSFNGLYLEHKGKDICNKHYVQLTQYRKLLDTTPSKHEKRKYWNNEDIKLLEKLYSEKVSMNEMVRIFKRTMGSITSKAVSLGLTDLYMKQNNPKFKAEYQDYDWCYDRFIIKNMSHQEMADEINVSKRVIQKWCVEIHKIDTRTYKYHKKLNDIQRQVIMFGLLGDGHIDRREDQPMYIESHAENQKDYLYWKYNILKDICKKEPSYKKPHTGEIRGVKCNIQGQYRLNTRIVDELKEIRCMNRLDIIHNLNEFGLSLHTLDDGYRDRAYWSVCIAEYTKEEIDSYISICKERFGLICYQESDERYIRYDSDSSRLLDEIILNNIPNNLDIIKYKITNNYICEPADYIYIHLQDGEKLGLNTYCRANKIPYLKNRMLLKDMDINNITEEEFLNLKAV